MTDAPPRPVSDRLAAIDLAYQPDFTLGRLRASPPTREIVANGVPATIEPRVMQVLVALARRRGEVVSRNDLIATCWGGRTVSDDAINRCIQAIRRLAEADGGFAVTTLTRIGYRLDETAGPTGPPVPAPQTHSERRRLTVLSCALVRASGMAASSLDPEDWQAVATAWRRAVGEAADPLGGHVIRGLADEVLIYFGYPQAQEDAAERAVRCGLAIVEGLGALKSGFAQALGADLAVRIGIDAGSVVIAADDRSVDLFGAAPDLATRVQLAAAADAVTVTAAVADRVRSRFVLTAAQPSLAGAGSLPPLFHLVSPRASARRDRRRPTPFVGREGDAETLLGLWRKARGGKGQFALLTGEPGLGKSRQIAEFRARLAGEPHLWLEAAGSPLAANTPFHAVARMLDQVLASDARSGRLQALERMLTTAGLDPAATLPLIAPLLNLDPPAAYPALGLAPEEARRRLLASLADWALAAAGARPLVIVVEDLQWIDPSTLELFQALAERGAGAALLLLGAARPEFRPPWPPRPHHTAIALERLDREATHALVSGLAVGRGGLDAAVIDAVIARADGVPLFAEELTRLMLDREGDASEPDIPASLQDSLAARLDRLGEAKAVAQLAAVLGRDFTHPLLAALSPLPERDLRAGLAALADAHLIHGRGAAPAATYQFRHALIREAAYESLLKSRRRDLHAQVAQMLTSGDPTLAEVRPEVRAHHWAEAGEHDKAVAAWSDAARSAEDRHAHEEAIVAYRRAILVLLRLPETPERDAREFDLSVPLSALVGIKQGFFSDDYVALGARAATLAERGGTLQQAVMQDLYSFLIAWSAADLPKACALADRLFGLAQREGGDLSLRVGHMAQVLAQISAANLDAADAHLVQWQLIAERTNVPLFTNEATGVIGAGAEVAYYRGHPDVARQRIAQALAMAEASGNPHELTMALVCKAWVHVLLREPRAAETAAARALALAEENGFNQANHARASLAWARAQLGATSEALELAEKSLVGWIGGGVPRLVEARRVREQVRALAGDPQGALDNFDGVFGQHEDNGVLRAAHLIGRADLQRQAGWPDAAEADLSEALALARRTGARGLELRAATGLALRLRARGERDAARALLAPVYGRFDPDLETTDLSEARQLLEALG
jgi:class 3 adenylate cyclase/tetratricopeptide (TPR) repeat protein